MGGVEEYADALAANGYPLVEVVTEHINSKLGHVIVTDTVLIDGEEFEGEPLLNLYADHTKDHPVDVHGIDVHSRADHSFSDARESLLNEYATMRNEMGDDWVTWTYHSQDQDDVDDNVAELCSAYRDVYDEMDEEIVSTSSQ